MVILFFLLSILPLAVANEEKTPAEKSPPNIGNFALPTPQQPGPLLSFGQHVINKGQRQLYLFTDYVSGTQQYTTDLMPSFVYGIEDDFSIFLNMPIALRYKNQNNHSSGMEDLSVQLEYAVYAKTTARFSDQITVVSNFNFPTGSVRKNPSTGSGSPSFFMGTTLSRSYTDWLGFMSTGVSLPTSSEQTRFGNQFLYQWGVGRNILSRPSEFIFTGMIELTGLYGGKNKIKGKVDSNSGGNSLFLTPSLWISTQKFIVQLGVGFPIVQRLFGDQHKNHYLLAANFGWTF